MTFDYTVNIRKPTRVLTRQWESVISAPSKRPRAQEYNDTYLDPWSNATCLNPYVDPGTSVLGKAGYLLLPTPDAWVEGASAFGDAGGYVAFAGNETYPDTTVWSAYRNPAITIDEDAAINISFWWTPTSTAFLPDIEIWPRVDWSTWKTINGYTYWFAPLRFYIDSTSSMLVVSEYREDSLDKFLTDPTSILTTTYQHPLQLGTQGLAGQWFQLRIIPFIESWQQEEPGTPPTNHIYYHHDFSVHSPNLVGGGFGYKTNIRRRNISLFPQGSPGMRSFSGGKCALNFSPISFPPSGYLISQKYAKTQSDTVRPDVLANSYTPSTTGVSIALVDEDGVEIPVGAAFQEYRLKTTLTASTAVGGKNWESPILYSIKPKTDQEVEDRVQDETDISGYTKITESMSDDLMGNKATITLFNREDLYNELIYRPLNEVTLQIGGVDRDIYYTLDPKFQWWQSPTREALTIVWEGGDFWVRMKSMYVAGHPDYGGQSIKDAITQYMQKLGFDATDLNIAASLDAVYLPQPRKKDDPIAKPTDGSTADEFIADLKEKWFSNFPTYFDVVDDGGVLKPRFNIDEPLVANDSDNIARTYYLSKADADAAFAADVTAYDDGDLDNPPAEVDYTYFCRKPTVSFMHKNYRNEIWVFGMDPATKEPIGDVWVDRYSQTDESYLYYVGERRLLVVVTRLPSKDFVTRYLYELIKVFGYVRRQISFETKYDPNLRPGDYIRFHNIGFVFQVTSTGVPIEPSNVSRSQDDTVQNSKIEAVQYPL